MKVFAQKVTHTKSFLPLLSTPAGRKAEVKWDVRLPSFLIRSKHQQRDSLSVLAERKGDLLCKDNLAGVYR